jgi:transposase-like protein
MDCPQCGAADVIEIKHRLPDDSEVQFFSCHRCEEKWWDRFGDQLNLREILELVRKARA